MAENFSPVEKYLKEIIAGTDVSSQEAFREYYIGLGATGAQAIEQIQLLDVGNKWEKKTARGKVGSLRHAIDHCRSVAGLPALLRKVSG